MLGKKAGNISEVAKSLNVSRTTVYEWINTDEKFKKALDDQQEALIDFAESSLLKSINNGSDTATIFFLKTKGKKRGYVERTELSGNDGKDLIPARTLTREEAKALLNDLENDC